MFNRSQRRIQSESSSGRQPSMCCDDCRDYPLDISRSVLQAPQPDCCMYEESPCLAYPATRGFEICSPASGPEIFWHHCLPCAGAASATVCSQRPWSRSTVPACRLRSRGNRYHSSRPARSLRQSPATFARRHANHQAFIRLWVGMQRNKAGVRHGSVNSQRIAHCCGSFWQRAKPDTRRSCAYCTHCGVGRESPSHNILIQPEVAKVSTTNWLSRSTELISSP